MTKLTKFLLQSVAGCIGVILFSTFIWTLSIASPLSAQIPLDDVSFPADIQAPSIVDLTVNPASYVPPNLDQSENPTEGTRAPIGLEDRVPMTSSNYPWSAVGRIIGIGADQSSYYCTGSLVATDIVLTNSHCVVDPETHEPSIAIQFQPNLVNGLLQDENNAAAAIAVEYGTDFRDDNAVPNPNDWAFIQLDKPLGEIYGTLGLATLSVEELIDIYDGQLVMVGYSRDFPSDNPGETAGAHRGCSVLGEVRDSLIHECDSFGGASGGPILADVDGEPRIVALHTGGRTQEYREEGSNSTIRVGVVNYAVKISRILDAVNQ
ncbi:MAG: trypsin-like serine peptidase [Elainellaceae cyanobacterium]